MFSWFTLVGNILNLIPGLENLAAQWHQAGLDSKVKMFIAQTGANRDTAVAFIQAQAQVQTRWWFVAVIPPLFALPYVIYTWKAVAWDKVISVWVTGTTGSTDPIGGTLGTAFLMILTFYFVYGMKGNSNGQ